MLFSQLSSELMKASLISKLAYSVGFKAIAASIKAKKPLMPLMEDGCNEGKMDYSPIEQATQRKKEWACLVEFAQTHSYKIDDIGTIAQAYVKGSGKPIQKVSTDIVNLRAIVSGTSIAGLHHAVDKQREVAIAKTVEMIKGIVSEFSDIGEYANEWYQDDVEDEEGNHHSGLLQRESVSIEKILLNDWVVENYPKVVKSQCAYWQRYQNWDDAELIMMAADQQLIGQ